MSSGCSIHRCPLYVFDGDFQVLLVCKLDESLGETATFRVKTGDGLSERIFLSVGTSCNQQKAEEHDPTDHKQLDTSDGTQFLETLGLVAH